MDENLARLRGIRGIGLGGDDAFFDEFIEDVAGSWITDAEIALNLGNGDVIHLHDLIADIFVDDFEGAFLEVDVRGAIGVNSSDGGFFCFVLRIGEIGEIGVIGRGELRLDEVGDAGDLVVMDHAALDTDEFAGDLVAIDKHIASIEQFFGARGVKDGARVHGGLKMEANTGI